MAVAAVAEDSSYAVSTLYFGNLHPDVAHTALVDVCLLFSTVEHVNVMRDKASGAPAGYAFVRFAERASAQAALDALHGQPWLGRELRLNWAFQSAPKDDVCHQFNVFVGDLAPEVTDATLYSVFKSTGCCQARVLWDHDTGHSKRYGFVSFRSQAEGDAAIAEMHGRYVGWSRIRCRWAQHKPQDASLPPPDALSVNRADAFNTNVYVGNVPQSWTEASLSTHFTVFGPLTDARLHKKGGYAFVRYKEHDHAVAAIVATQGTTVNGQVLKCSWGKAVPVRSQQSFQQAADTLYFTHPMGAVAAEAALPHAHHHPTDSGLLLWPSGGGVGAGAGWPFWSAAPGTGTLAPQSWGGAGSLQQLQQLQQQQQQQQMSWYPYSVPVAGPVMEGMPMTGQAWQMAGPQQMPAQVPQQGLMWSGGGGGPQGSNGSGGMMAGQHMHSGRDTWYYG